MLCKSLTFGHEESQKVCYIGLSAMVPGSGEQIALPAYWAHQLGNLGLS